MSNNSFVNPYNFIPLSNEAPYRKPVKKGNLTGIIRYTLRTRTPLIIPNTSNDHAFDVKCNGEPAPKEHKSYDFFSYDDLSKDDAKKNGLLNKNGFREGKFSEPVIPGSEIRGMLRSYYEILTNSCMSFVDDDEVLSKRTLEAYKPGLIERQSNGEFVLYTAEDCILRGSGSKKTGYAPIYKNANYNEGQKVYFEKIVREWEVNGETHRAKSLAGNVQTDPHDDYEEGFVIKGEGEEGPKFDKTEDKYKEKHNIHIFTKGRPFKTIKDKSGEEIPVALKKEEIRVLSTCIDIYAYNGKSLYEEYQIEWKNFAEGKGETMFPVYYSIPIKDSGIMLSPACITREIYSVKLKDILRGHYTCDSKGSLCPACALFGMLGKDFSVNSRIRVADMHLKANKKKESLNSLYEPEVTLQSLNSPKINNMEFYIKRPDDAWFWTYEYYIDKNGNIHSYLPEINGRKFYWHQPDMEPVQAKAEKLNATMRPLKAGVEFSGEIYFENLNEAELYTLVYAVNAGDSEVDLDEKIKLDNKKQCYKLGHAKPLGYGSVAMKVDSVKLRKIELDSCNSTIKYSIDEDVKISKPKLDNTIMHNFRIMTCFEYVKGKSIDYPRPTESDENGEYPIFKWFVENHGGYNHKKKKTVPMPNSRLQMTYLQHMYSLEPELRETGALKHERTRGSSAGGHHGTCGSANRQNGQVIEVTVESVGNRGTIYFMADGKKGRVYGDRLKGRDYKIGDKVKVRLYKDNGNYAVFNLAE